MGSLGFLEQPFGSFKYPEARRDDTVVEDYHGVKVTDPYRWLEDSDAEEVKQFVKNQVALTETVLENCDTRDKLRNKITNLFDHPRYTVPFKRGDKYFYFHNTGLQAQNVLYMQDGLGGKPEVLLDPNTLSEDGTVSLKALSVSEDAKYLAYGLSSSGSDWVNIKVMRIDDKTEESDSLSWIKFSDISWTHDGKGFFYSRYPVPKDGENIDSGIETSVNVNHELYYHFLGTNQSEDILCWRDPQNPKHMFSGRVTNDGKYLVLNIDEGCGPVNKLYLCDLSALPGGLGRERNGALTFVKLIDDFDAQYINISNDESMFTFLTNKDAPKYKLVRVNLNEPSKWIDVIPENEKDVLESACVVNGNQMIVNYMSNVKYVLQVRDFETGSLLHNLPIDIGTVYGISARREDSTVFIGFTSFLAPGIIYQCNLATELPEMKIFREISVPGFDRSEFEVNQVFVPSKDGTKIPMFIVGRKDTVLDGSHPCLLYGYGGFNVSLTPSFSVSRIVLARHLGAFFCIANIRGGGEYGEEWHKAGALAKKQTCFDDFISAAEYLISSGYTMPEKLCIEGGSNGGLLVGACINQRPELFSCALAHVGVMDMLRFHKFTIGHAWTCDFGCSENEEDFNWLIKYSPLHNVRRPWEKHPGGMSQYPSTMLLTADHDDRVVPLHSLKMLATMQHVLCTSLENSPQTNPIIGRIECKAGHGCGRPTQKLMITHANHALLINLPRITRRPVNLGPNPLHKVPVRSKTRHCFNPFSSKFKSASSFSNARFMGSLSALKESLEYPIARRDDSVVDDYHGVKIADPYRWLEDPDAEEVKEFVQRQVKLTESVLEKCELKDKLREKITKLFDHPRYDVPFKRGKKYFYHHNTGLQAQSVLYVQDSLDGEAEVLLDPNLLSEDGTVALSSLSVSEDAKYLAYSLSSSGSDWVTIKVMRVEDKTAEPDTLSWVKFSGISWTHDSKGFFYSRYPAPKEGENVDAGTETDSNLNQELYYHFLGTDQSEDILCWKDPENPKHSAGGSVTDDGKYLLLTITEGCDPVNKLYYCDLSSLDGGLEGFKKKNGPLPYVKLVDTFDAQYYAIANDDTVFTFHTNKDAPKYKIIRVDLKEPNNWVDVIPESDKDVLESADAVYGNQMIVSYLSDVKYVLQVRDLNTGSLLHQLPIDIGSVSRISARREDSVAFIGFTSFLTPGIIYQCNLATEVPDMKIFREISVPGFDRSEFEVTQVFAPSKDGTKIPMFIVGRKNTSLDGSHPCLLYGYGGFNISLTPTFSVSRIVLTRHLGAFFCIANIRGGGEYGEEWHKAGALSKKQNCFDDFISAAEYLISAGYTRSEKLCIEGGSNGGLLIGACINQKPDLFGCALAHVGVMDMLRFHKFTIGHAWTTDYGCSDNEEDFHWLIKYSPVHNVRRPWEQHPDQTLQYPPTMLLTADHDDRVVPLHSLKYLATLQYVLCTSLEKSPQTNPIIGRIECKAGHGAGRPTQKMIDEAAERYGFMAKMLGAPWIE